MGNSVTLVAQPFRPSSPLSGEESSCIFRGANVLLAGKLGLNYLRAYAGSLNIGENYTGVALTGTVTFSPSSTTVTGAGTSFLDELHLGQLIMANIIYLRTLTDDYGCGSECGNHVSPRSARYL